MKILATGSLGHIGRHLCQEVDADGLDLKKNENVCYGVKGDYDAIVHLAAFMHGEYNLTDNNVISTRKVVDYCKETGAKLIFASSAAVYGQGGEFPLKEDSPLLPIDEYGRSKLKCEKIISANLENYVIFRLSNIYPTDGVISHFQKGENVIYGDGTHVRDYLDVDSVIRAILICLYNDVRGTYNLSSGRGKSTNQAYREINPDKEPVYLDLPKDEIAFSILDNKKWRSVENKYQ